MLSRTPSCCLLWIRPEELSTIIYNIYYWLLLWFIYLNVSGRFNKLWGLNMTPTRTTIRDTNATVITGAQDHRHCVRSSRANMHNMIQYATDYYFQCVDRTNQPFILRIYLRPNSVGGLKDDSNDQSWAWSDVLASNAWLFSFPRELDQFLSYIKHYIVAVPFHRYSTRDNPQIYTYIYGIFSSDYLWSITRFKVGGWFQSKYPPYI